MPAYEDAEYEKVAPSAELVLEWLGVRGQPEEEQRVTVAGAWPDLTEADRTVLREAGLAPA